MRQHELDNLKHWFSDYCRTFYTPEQTHQKNILLKEQHTHNVCENITEIAKSLSLDADRRILAETIALFHDVGRFEQYRKYHTFNDHISANHAALGVKVLIENKVLADLAEREREIIVHAVALHNVFAVPDGIDPDTFLFLKMIRDADKLDIWRVFIEYYNQPDQDRAAAVALDLPDVGGYSHEVLAALLRREMVHLSTLRTLNDFKLLQLSWIFDLQFNRSLQLLEERKYIDQLAGSLPSTTEIMRAIDSLHEYVLQKLQSG